ncbi:MAG: hypothetical protein J7M38_12285 [Armatimonadetes bacterium]|nr:hypothetical protein [Armatimonadota bacterium]
MSAARDRRMFEQLERLALYATVSYFTQDFYALIADCIHRSGAAGTGVADLFVAYLRVEENYHAALAAVSDEDATELADVRHAAEKREIGLRSVLEMINETRASRDAEIARVLLAAECYYHLEITDRVVERLETAVALGADDPLVYFALGYNRFQLATEAFTAYDTESGERRVIDEDRYRVACLNAISAFQDGLTGDEFDGQLHWWIGRVLEAAGFSEAARLSMLKAARMIGDADAWEDIDRFEDEAGVWEKGLLDPVYDDDLGPITASEIAEAAVLLRRPFSPSDLNWS